MFLGIVARYDIKDMWELFGDLWSNINRVASQSSNKVNIPFIGKGIYGMKEKVAWMRWVYGNSWEGLGNHGLLEQGRKICSGFMSKELLQTKPTGKY